ncbi:unnamed protein product [Arabis nemorensis]|uniref:Uncharacterized protein n=1 Tax=Arabis nemorensis TaxID=586526 RepID=A0A565C6S8_9BRAS|nr:unnamed protein product [Arabis nemorensis]
MARKKRMHILEAKRIRKDVSFYMCRRISVFSAATRRRRVRKGTSSLNSTSGLIGALSDTCAVVEGSKYGLMSNGIIFTRVPYGITIIGILLCGLGNA